MSREDQESQKKANRRDNGEMGPTWYQCSTSLHHAGLLVAVGLHARGSGSFRVGGRDHRLGVGFVENGLDDLLLVGAENLGQAVVELGLLLLEIWNGR